MGQQRRYDDREVGLILTRVAELHQREGGPADARAMTRAEIENVVAELGISRALVTRAVSELSVEDHRNRPVWLLGGKTDVMFEEVVPGTIDDAMHTEMLEVLRRLLGEPGKVEREGTSRIWSAAPGGTGPVYFTVVQHEDTTTLRLETDMRIASRATVGSGTGAGGFAGFMSLVPLKALVAKAVLMLALGPLVLVGATAGWLAGRMVWRRLSRAREELLRRAFGEILGLAHGRDRRLPPASEPDPT